MNFLLFSVSVSCVSFMFDEPSSYLDVKQRLKAAITIRSLITPDRWVEPLIAAFSNIVILSVYEQI